MGVVHLFKIPQSNKGSLKLIIIDDFQKKGLGTKLLNQAIEIGKKENLEGLEVQILNDNEAMKKMLTRAGFTFEKNSKNETLKAHLNLN